jgi:hypothetical protein
MICTLNGIALLLMDEEEFRGNMLDLISFDKAFGDLFNTCKVVFEQHNGFGQYW